MKAEMVYVLFNKEADTTR